MELNTTLETPIHDDHVYLQAFIEGDWVTVEDVTEQTGEPDLAAILEDTTSARLVLGANVQPWE